MNTDSRIKAISVSRWYDPFAVVAVISATYLALRDSIFSDAELSLVIIAAASLYFFLSELSRASWRGVSRPRDRFSDVLSRSVTKFIGVLFGTVCILFALWLFPEYGRASYGRILAETFPVVLAFLVPLSFILIVFTEWILGEKRDGTYQFGLLMQLRIKEMDWDMFLTGVLEWLVRCIFLLINFFAAYFLLARIRTSPLPHPDMDLATLVSSTDSIIFALILFSILPGYLFASRLIGTEVKQVDRSWFGWMITLSSYSPLNAAVFTAWVSYRPQGVFGDVPAWVAIGSAHPLLLYTFAGTIIVAGLFHLWGEATMGIRSSNLSRRGIITTGPFAFTKHPVYVSKCVQWAFLYLPFLNAVDVLDATRSAILFALVCALFAARALAEEKLLAEDPDYVAYARHMDTHSVFAFVGRALPFMSFRWRYEYWRENGYLSRSH